jgi:hypothetical protein
MSQKKRSVLFKKKYIKHFKAFLVYSETAACLVCLELTLEEEIENS